MTADVGANPAESVKKLVLENTRRRDELIAYEKRYQAIWKEERVFEVNPPHGDGLKELSQKELHRRYPKFFTTIAYPYMNGVLHAGHAFTLSKADFAVGFERMLGKRAIFPLGFHCTGMPIKACADKLAREIEQFGLFFDQNQEDSEIEPDELKSTTEAGDPSKFRSQKSKATAKAGTAKYQYQIMLQLGIPREEIHKFADAHYWIYYFPSLCQRDCNAVGARIDWRRSMVTTDVNPYYDSMIQWQMRTLKTLGKIKFGKRYTIFSPKDDQPCMDHDRQKGEAVNPQEYVALKMELLEVGESDAKVQIDKLKAAGKRVFLVAATLRPETMYAQTCLFVSPKITYGLFEAKDNNYFICTKRAFRNMAYQDLSPTRGYWEPLMEIPGDCLIGAKIKAPLAMNCPLRVVPMETILPTKGTGVVSCVPSDSPDDWITCVELKKKPEFYKIDPDWIHEPISVITTPTYGDMTAKTLCEQLKIVSPKNYELLAKAKELAYKEGFYQGIMNIGPYKGMKVEDAKTKVRNDMIEQDEAFIYSEPEGLVISRSSDECVVSLQDQWFNNYGEESWKQQAQECLSQIETYMPEVRNAFEKVLDWLGNWALSRTYGLGTRIPWDPQYLVESLSDSTVYMAYYTISHLLHSDFYGKVPGELNISASDMTDEVWDYIFCRSKTVSDACKISKENLDRMRYEFRYFYPLDVSVSGKDLIPNHLTFFIYCHTALFDESNWPRGIRCNGHLLLNNEKMSKSTGNFMTLEDMVQKFGADASRIALADAGDTFEDANFDESSANAAILRLHTLKEWMEHVLANLNELRHGEPNNFFDQIFAAELDRQIIIARDAYEHAQYKAALKAGLFDLQISRDYYREVCNTLGIGMHEKLVLRYIEIQVLLLLPIAPHFAEYVWRDLFKRNTTIHVATFPEPNGVLNASILDAAAYIRNTSRAIREAEGQALKKKKKGPIFDSKKPSRLSIYISTEFPDWQKAYVDLVTEKLETLDFKEMTPQFKKDVGSLGDPKRGMQFVNMLRLRILNGEDEKDVLDRGLKFDEKEVALKAQEILKASVMSTNVTEFEIIYMHQGQAVNILTGRRSDVPSAKPVNDAVPGSPGIILANIA